MSLWASRLVVLAKSVMIQATSWKDSIDPGVLALQTSSILESPKNVSIVKCLVLNENDP